MLWQYTKQAAAKRFFPLSNEIFSLDLSSEIEQYISFICFFKVYETLTKRSFLLHSICYNQINFNVGSSYLCEGGIFNGHES